ncbi:MAG: hypothetical protein AAB250_07975, partial [Bdellovibrionota bacterium]
GTNSLYSKTPSVAYQTKSIQVRAKAKCQWIGPPHLNPMQAVGWSSFKRGSAEDVEASRKRIDSLQDNLEPFYNSLAAKVGTTCRLIDSRPATVNGSGRETNDGIHRGPIGGRVWADLVRGQVLR